MKQLIYSTLFITVLAAAQSGVAISPVPILPAGVEVPSDSKQFVFRGPAIDEITISFPERLAQGDSLGKRTVLRTKLLNQARPAMIATVSARPSGGFEYSYAVQNRAGAAGGIKVISVGVPSDESVDTPANAGWAVARSVRADVAADSISATVPVQTVTWRAGGSPAIPQNGRASGFRIGSKMGPGFTMSFARSADDFDLPANLPAEVKAQLAVLYEPEWLNAVSLTIGPRYPANWPRHMIVSDFLYGIGRLIRSGELSPKSPFVVAAETSLETAIASQISDIWPQLDYLDKASGDLETSIASAMKISLR